MTMQHWFVLLDTYSNMHYMITVCLMFVAICRTVWVLLSGDGRSGERHVQVFPDPHAEGVPGQ